MSDQMTEREIELAKELMDLSHAMQSGVAAMMKHDPAGTEPKHLRVGVNAAMVYDSALVHLLVSKGLFTSEEYAAAMVEGMRTEVKRYEKELSELTGVNVTLK